VLLPQRHFMPPSMNRAYTLKPLARFERSRRSLAGGVSSGIRRAARPYPLFFTSGHGAQVTDVDQNTYVDYGLAWGPLRSRMNFI
jgi:glutamate-1-semialdehyde aminotransferase